MKTLIFILALFLFSCDCAKNDADDLSKRFIKVYEQSIDGGWLVIYRDKQTGEEYLFEKNGYGGGLTLMPKRKSSPEQEINQNN